MKSRFFKISLYVSREVLFSFLISFLFFFVIFFINQILLSARDQLAKGVSLLDVLQIVLYAIPSIVFLAAPFASLGAVVLAFGRLSADNEILAMQALGLSRHRIFIPVLIIGLSLTISSFLINDILMPLGGIQQRRLIIDIALNNAQVDFAPFSVKKLGNQTIVTGDVQGREIRNPLLFNRTADQKIEVVEADKATFQKGQDRKTVLSLELDKVKSLTPDLRSITDYDFFSADKMIFNVFSKDINAGLSSPTAAEMSTVDVFKRIVEMEKNLKNREDERQNNISQDRFELRQNYREALEEARGGSQDQPSLERPLIPLLENLKVEEGKVIKDYLLVNFKIQYYQKFSIPLGCAELILIGFSVAIFNKRRGRAFSIVLGIGISFVYWILLFAAQLISQQGFVLIDIAMFIPNILLLFLGLGLYWARRLA